MKNMKKTNGLMSVPCCMSDEAKRRQALPNNTPQATRELPNYSNVVQAIDPEMAIATDSSRYERGYLFFVANFVRVVVGCVVFDSCHKKKHISEFVGVTDEALALLLWENQENRWNDMVERGLHKSALEGKCTDGGKCRADSGRSRRGKGWSAQGIKRFNQLCRLVEADRDTEARKQFEVATLAAQIIRDYDEGGGRKRKSSSKFYVADNEYEEEDVFVEK